MLNSLLIFKMRTFDFETFAPPSNRQTIYNRSY